jgi:hypothetical protein
MAKRRRQLTPSAGSIVPFPAVHEPTALDSVPTERELGVYVGSRLAERAAAAEKIARAATILEVFLSTRDLRPVDVAMACAQLQILREAAEAEQYQLEALSRVFAVAYEPAAGQPC